MSTPSSLQVAGTIVDVFASAATPLDLCRSMVHDFPLSSHLPSGSCLGVVSQSSKLISLSSYGRMPFCQGTELELWGDHPISSFVRAVTCGVYLEPEIGPVLVVPLVQNRFPIGAMILTFQENLPNILEEYSESLLLLSQVGGFYLKGLNVPMATGLRGDDPDSAGVQAITTRQLEIIAFMSQGLNNREIAGQVLVSESTVRQESIRIYRSLGVSSRTEAVAKARILGLIEPISSPGVY